jgi:VanZ family protein
MTSDSSKSRLIGLLAATAAAALAMATLLPARWVPRTGHWEVEHFLAYLATTMVLSIASRRPIIVAGSLIMFAGILEVLQGLTPDRFPDVASALCGAAGVISAATLVLLLLRMRRSRMFPNRIPGFFIAQGLVSPNYLGINTGLKREPK